MNSHWTILGPSRPGLIEALALRMGEYGIAKPSLGHGARASLKLRDRDRDMTHSVRLFPGLRAPGRIEARPV
jgi:hypothetical protein